MLKEKAIAIIKQLKEELEGVYADNLASVILYGSYARDEAHAGSDIDILVVLRRMTNFWKEHDKIVDVTARLSLANDLVISAFPVTPEELTRRTALMLNVAKEGVEV